MNYAEAMPSYSQKHNKQNYVQFRLELGKTSAKINGFKSKFC